MARNEAGEMGVLGSCQGMRSTEEPLCCRARPARQSQRGLCSSQPGGDSSQNSGSNQRRHTRLGALRTFLCSGLPRSDLVTKPLRAVCKFFSPRPGVLGKHLLTKLICSEQGE